MFKVGALVACFYIWSNGQILPVETGELLISEKKPNVIVGMIKEIHHSKKTTVDASIIEDAPLSVKSEDQTILEIESKKEKMLYFINISACKSEPTEEDVALSKKTEEKAEAVKLVAGEKSADLKDENPKLKEEKKEEPTKTGAETESVVNDLGKHIKEGLGL
jgi:hypothetical protein